MIRTTKSKLALVSGLALSLGLAGCGQTDAQTQDQGASPSGEAATQAAVSTDLTEVRSSTDVAAFPADMFSVSVWAEGLEIPWGMAFLPDGSALVTERENGLRRVVDGKPGPLIEGLPTAYTRNQAGYLDIALDPDFAQNRRIYMSYATGTDEANSTAVFAGRLSEDASRIEEGAVIFEVPFKKRRGFHYGSRFGFLADGTLLVTLGEGAIYTTESQNLGSHLGTIVRINTDGTVPQDNPFIGQQGALPEIYSYGHRNVQGLVIDPASGRIYAHEHGPKGGDELNLIEAGANYGWPVITYGINYDGTIVTEETVREGMKQPLVQWTPSIAPAGLVLYSGGLFGDWTGDLISSNLAGNHLRWIDLGPEGQVLAERTFLSERGERYRSVVVGPDGALYASVDDIDGTIIRVAPAG
jgi:aldose sugar dehydrogenase